MKTIRETLQNVMQALETKKEASKGDPQNLLRKVLTKEELAHTKFGYFKRGTININVDSSTRLYCLNLKKESLLVKLNKKSSAIQNIRFRLGDIR